MLAGLTGLLQLPVATFSQFSLSQVVLEQVVYIYIKYFYIKNDCDLFVSEKDLVWTYKHSLQIQDLVFSSGPADKLSKY